MYQVLECFEVYSDSNIFHQLIPLFPKVFSVRTSSLYYGHNSCSIFSFFTTSYMIAVIIHAVFFSVSYNFLYCSPMLLKFWGSNFSTINDSMSTALFHLDFSEQQLYQSNLVSLILIMCTFLNSPLRHSYSHICNLNFCLIMFYFVL